MKVSKNILYLKAWSFLLLNERIQIENEYSWLWNPYESKARPVFPVSEMLKCLL